MIRATITRSKLTIKGHAQRQEDTESNDVCVAVSTLVQCVIYWLKDKSIIGRYDIISAEPGDFVAEFDIPVYGSPADVLDVMVYGLEMIEANNPDRIRVDAAKWHTRES